ncbi:hypothetical protein N9X99_04115, partial [Gammaproteobacteria bacterium]|nr:hypothetical protein [Gammaproteobacteria bacterium]
MRKSKISPALKTNAHQACATNHPPRQRGAPLEVAVQIYARDLQRQLKAPHLPLYWVAGDEPFLSQEASDSIRAFLRKQGFTEREVFSLSLFAERRVIELRFKNAKPDEAGKKALEKFLESPSDDT